MRCVDYKITGQSVTATDLGCVRLFLLLSATFVCCAGATALYKALSSDGIPLSVVLPAQTSPSTLSLQTRYHQLAVVVDVGCADDVTFVAQ